MMAIEAFRLFVFGVDDQGVNGNLGPGGPVHRIPQQGASKFEAPIGESDRKASETCDGN
jgi:hypothetical protein